MKQFISFIRKEFFHIFRDRRTMLILLGMPIVQIILFGFAITTEVKNVRVAVLDPSNDVVTRRIIDRMDASEYFTVIRRLHSPADMEASFGRGEIDMALVFSERFSDKLYTGEARVQLVSDATDPNMATMQAGYAANIISSAGSACRCHRTPAQAAVQSADEECLQLRAGCHGAYSDADLRHDDLHLHCAREGDGDDGGPAGFSRQTAFHHSGKGGALFCAVVCQLDHHSSAFGLCARCSRGGQLVLAGGGVAAIHLCLPGAGAADFHGHPDAGCRHAGVRTDADDAHHVAFGHDIPH